MSTLLKKGAGTKIAAYCIHIAKNESLFYYFSDNNKIDLINFPELMKLDDLLSQNIHWQGGGLASVQYSDKRDAFFEIAGELQSRFALTISGLRRTGKSVLMTQLCEAFFEQNPQLDPKQLLKFSFEREDDLDLLPSEVLKSLLLTYFKEILRQHPQDNNAKILIALDEIQNIKNWQSVIKSFYDLNPQIKFILTGSSALYLDHAAESLAGRCIDYRINCLSFREYLRLTQQQEKYPQLFVTEDEFLATPFFVTADVIEEFEKFILIGGFPDTAIMSHAGKAVSEVQSFLWKSIVLKIIRKDLRKYFNFKESYPDERLFELCCSESGNFLAMPNLATEVGLSIPTIKSHLEAFSKSALISFLTKFDRKLRREIKATRKLYLASPSLMYAALNKQSVEDKSFLGHAVETYIFNRLLKRGELYVDRGKEVNQEVDFYLPNKNLLLECKYSSRIDVRQFKYLRKRAKELGAEYKIISKDAWSKADLSCIPAFML